jgi:hypothetical protein
VPPAPLTDIETVHEPAVERLTWKYELAGQDPPPPHVDDQLPLDPLDTTA